MNKILTISVAGYNVESFISYTLDTLLIDDIEKIEVLVIDDGGNDATAEIVSNYEKTFPNSIRLIHKENGGYGSTINKSVCIAQGKYFKQLDGDDWYHKENLSKLINILNNLDADIIYTPFIHYYESEKKEFINDRFPPEIEGLYDIEDVISKRTNNLVMHNLAFKTQLLKDNDITITEHCFYTDTEYALYPFAYAKTIYISHIPIYYYRIGRDEQSVSISSRRKNYKQHLKVDDEILKNYSLFNGVGVNTKEYIEIFITETVSSGIANFLMIQKPSKSALNEIKERDLYLKTQFNNFYTKTNKISVFLRLLRKSNYLLYYPLYFLKIIQLKNRNMKKF